MDILRQHEKLEIEVLEYLNSTKLLETLVFGGGTMLRLCHELNRYSTDLDLWFIKKTDTAAYFSKIKKVLLERYALNDVCDKFNTLLFEIKAQGYPRLLKIEIRKEIKNFDWQEKIAYSKFTEKQVLLKTHTLEQTMSNKIEAALNRVETRDFFDIEFLIRRGIGLPSVSKTVIDKLLKTISSFKPNDYKVKLGSILDPEARRYYNENGFSFLKESLIAVKNQ